MYALPIHLDEEGLPGVIQYYRYNQAHCAFMVRWIDGSWSFVMREDLEGDADLPAVYRAYARRVRSAQDLSVMYSGIPSMRTAEAARFLAWAEHPDNAHLIGDSNTLSARAIRALLA